MFCKHWCTGHDVYLTCMITGKLAGYRKFGWIQIQIGNALAKANAIEIFSVLLMLECLNLKFLGPPRRDIKATLRCSYARGHLQNRFLIS